ncbi:MAG: hypothetical protein RLY17_1091 [Pseudomonadota bacterium]|jgi:hypothetical protein
MIKIKTVVIARERGGETKMLRLSLPERLTKRHQVKFTGARFLLY